MYDKKPMIIEVHKWGIEFNLEHNIKEWSTKTSTISLSVKDELCTRISIGYEWHWNTWRDVRELYQIMIGSLGGDKGRMKWWKSDYICYH